MTTRPHDGFGHDMEEPADGGKKSAEDEEETETETDVPGCDAGSGDEAGVGRGGPDADAADGGTEGSPESFGEDAAPEVVFVGLTGVLIQQGDVSRGFEHDTEHADCKGYEKADIKAVADDADRVREGEEGYGTSGFNVGRGEDAEEDGGDKTDDDTDQDCVESEYFFLLNAEDDHGTKGDDANGGCCGAEGTGVAAAKEEREGEGNDGKAQHEHDNADDFPGKEDTEVPGKPAEKHFQKAGDDHHAVEKGKTAGGCGEHGGREVGGVRDHGEDVAAAVVAERLKKCGNAGTDEGCTDEEGGKIFAAANGSGDDDRIGHVDGKDKKVLKDAEDEDGGGTLSLTLYTGRSA